MADELEPPPPVAPPPALTYQPPPNDTIDRLIPTRNPNALTAYYIGVFSIMPCLGAVMGPAAVVLGMKGLKAIDTTPGLPGRGHAITGIVCGSIFGLFNIALLIFFIVLLVNNPPNR